MDLWIVPQIYLLNELICELEVVEFQELVEEMLCPILQGDGEFWPD